MAGELGAFDPLNDDRRDEGRSKDGGGNMLEGVLGIDGVGVNNTLLLC